MPLSSFILANIMTKHIIQKLAQEIAQSPFKAPTVEELLVRKLEKMGLKQNIDGTYSANGDVKLESDTVKGGKLNFKIKKVNGNFSCYNLSLISLVGCPDFVGGDFRCANNKLTDLVGCPSVIKGSFDCAGNRLTSLEGCPDTINGNFTCAYNKLTTLKGGPKVVNGGYGCSHNTLTNLIGSPEIINGGFFCIGTNLTSLEGCPKIVYKDFWISQSARKFTVEEVRAVCDIKGKIIRV